MPLHEPIPLPSPVSPCLLLQLPVGQGSSSASYSKAPRSRKFGGKFAATNCLVWWNTGEDDEGRQEGREGGREIEEGREENRVNMGCTLWRKGRKVEGIQGNGEGEEKGRRKAKSEKRGGG